MLLSSVNRLSRRILILTVSLLTAAVGLIISQTILVSEVNGAKRLEVDCTLFGVDGGIETRYCCMYEIDEETGDKTLVECWWEQCHIGTDICDTHDPGGDSNIPDGQAGPTDEREVLPSPDIPIGPIPRGITDRPLGQQEVLPTPPETTSPEETGITDRPVDEREVLPAIPGTTTPLGETSPLQPPPPLTVEEQDEGEQTEPETTPEPVECTEGEIFNEQTGQCEPEEEPEVEEEQSSEEGDGSEDNNSNN